MNINERDDHSANELTSLCPSYSPHGTGGNADADADPIQIMRSNTFTTTAGSPTFVWRHFVFGASACLLLLGIGTHIHIDSKHVFAGLKQDFKISNNDKNLLGGFGGDAIISENQEIQVHISPFHLLQKSQCFQDKKYSSHTAKTAYELPFAAMFKDTKDEKKFEASSLIKVDDSYYAICDNSWAISKFDASLTPFSPSNVQIGDPNREEEDSGYEAILYFNQTFFVVRESVTFQIDNSQEDREQPPRRKLHHHRHHHKKHQKKKHQGDNKHEDDEDENVKNNITESGGIDVIEGNKTANTTPIDTLDDLILGGTKVDIAYHAIIEELVIENNDYTIIDQCRSEFEFEGDSKGFEGAFGMPGLDGILYIVALCEGNYCSESRKDHAGNGQMVLMKKNTTNPDDCIWQTVKMISIPKTAHFRDYSDIDVTPSGKVAITTQEDSALWIGQLNGIENGVMDLDALEFDEDSYKLYSFPKSNECLTVYCNIEGITFINDDMVMAVSDKMKGKGKQPYWCLEKDQSIHAFVLP